MLIVWIVGDVIFLVFCGVDFGGYEIDLEIVV